MNELHVWVCFGGDEPDSIRELLDLVREPEAVDEPDWEALSQRVIASVRGGQLHGGSGVAIGDDQKEERTDSEEASAPTLLRSAPTEGLTAAPPVPALPDAVAALVGPGATGAGAQRLSAPWGCRRRRSRWMWRARCGIGGRRR